MGFSSGSSSSQGASYGYNQSMAQSMQDVWGPQATALQGLYGAAQGMAGRGVNPALQGAANNSVLQMQQFANPNSALAQRQTQLLSKEIGTQFGREILPQIRTGAGIGGNMGGSREALARGVAAGDASRAIAQGATDFYGQQYGLAQQAAGAVPGMAGQAFSLGWGPLQNLANIMGGPTVLGRSQAASMGENSAWNQGTSRQFGFNLW